MKNKSAFSQKWANALLLLTSLIWGGGFVVSQMALDSGLSPFHMIAGRMLVASIVLDVLFFRRLKTVKKEEVKAGILMGICLFGGFLFQTFGLVYTTPSINAFITAVYVVLIPFINLMIFKKKPDIYSNVSAVLTLLGIGLISITDGFTISAGVFLTLICAVFYAFQFITTDHYAKRYDPIKLTVIMMNFNFIVGSILALSTDLLTGQYLKLTKTGVFSILYLGLFSTLIGFLGQNIGQKYTTAIKAAVIMSTEAVFGALFSVLLYQEVFSLKMAAGCTFILIAIIISETKLSFFKKKINN